MARSPIAAFEARLRRRKVPLTFGGWNFTTYNVADLRQILEVLNVGIPAWARKLDLCVFIHTQRPTWESLSFAERAVVQAIKIARSSTRDRLRGRILEAPSNQLQTESVVASDNGNEGPTERHVMRARNSTEQFTYTPKAENETETAPNQDSRSSPPEPLACRICLEETTHDLRSSKPITASCRHEHDSICMVCLIHHIRAQSDSVDLDAVTCPHKNCDAVLGHNDMHHFASADVFARYDDYMNKKALEELPAYQQCADPGCNDGCFIDEEDSFVTCPSCNTMTCISCNTRYHPGMTHAENQEAIEQQQLEICRNKDHREEERKTEKAIEALGAKPCPGDSCGILMHKISGCDHITCRRCGHHFCYRCLADHRTIVREGNHRHNEGCIHYRPLPRNSYALYAAARLKGTTS